MFCIASAFVPAHPGAGLQGTAEPPGGKYFDFSNTAKDIYQKILSLRFREAQTSLDALRKQEPDNLISVFLDNYLDFLTVYTTDDRSEYKQRAGNMDARLDKIAHGDHHSPYYLYCQAEIRLQWAFLRLRHSEYLSAMSDVKQAFALLEENQRRFPDFVANRKSLGIMHAIVGNIPEEYRWAVRLLSGMSGSTEQGLKELESVLAYAKNNDFVFEGEATVAYSFLLLFLNNAPDEAYKTLKNSKLQPKTNPLANYAVAMAASRAGQNDDAIRLLQEPLSGGPYQPFYYRDYLLGLAKMRRLDLDAHQPLEVFLNNFKGENGVKEGYQKLAWYHLVNDNELSYHTYMGYVKLKGVDNAESDKAALREARSGEMPDPVLLKARLLSDGGYYQRAYDLLQKNAGRYSTDHKLALEYNYRMGRVEHKLGKTQDAQRFYTQTIDTGYRDPWYFACNAALQLGILHEEKRDFKNARLAFNRCLGMTPEEYAGSLHAQAKAGLGRIRNK